jgi:penicillin amidase
MVRGFSSSVRARGLGAVSAAFVAVCGACGESDARLAPAAATPVAGDAGTPPAAAALGPLGHRLATNERLAIDGLAAPVDIVRDETGTTHIYASALEDALRAQGYAMARDRSIQLELLRRLAEGRTAELLGDGDPTTIDQDIAMRMIGLERAARGRWGAMREDSEPRRLLAAFADGVSQYFERVSAGDEPLPSALAGVSRAWFATRWDGADVLAILGFYAFAASYSGLQELAFHGLLGTLQATYAPSSPISALARRAGIERDLLRFAPLAPDTLLGAAGFSAAGGTAGPSEPAPGPAGPSSPPGPAQGSAPWTRLSLDGYTRATAAVLASLGRPGQIGSNAWALGPSKSAPAVALLAADPHLALALPAVFWPVHLEVAAPSALDAGGNLSAAGLALAGVPGPFLGFNHHVAWGAAVSGVDLTDVYYEKLTADGNATLWRGQPVALTHAPETIRVAGHDDLVYDVLVVPHHGPVVPTILWHTIAPPDPSVGAVSVRWLGLEVPADFDALLRLWRARDVDGARDAVRALASGGWTFVFADRVGRTRLESPPLVPSRDARAFAWSDATYRGQLPCLVLEGGGNAEWTGWVEQRNVPRLASPPEGFVAAANADPTGATLDNDPSNDRFADGTRAYFGCAFDVGFRQARIRRVLAGSATPFDTDLVSALQADVRSPLGQRFVPPLLATLARAFAEVDEPGTFPDLGKLVHTQRFAEANVPAMAKLLRDWGEQTDYRAATGLKLGDGLPSSDARESLASRATLLFDTWLVRVWQLAFADETGAVGAPAALVDQLAARALAHLLETEPWRLATFDLEARDSMLWDDLTTSGLETRNEILLGALLDAAEWIEGVLGKQREDWRWGAVHTVRFDPLLSGVGLRSVPPIDDPAFARGFPRGGDLFVVDAAPYDSMPQTFSALSFRYGVGAAARLVVRMAEDGPAATSVIAGGASLDPASAHYDDDLEYWRNGRAHPFAFALAEVIASARSRAVAASEKAAGP